MADPHATSHRVATIECAAKLLGADTCTVTNCSECGKWTHAHMWRDWESGGYELTDELCDRCKVDA